MDSLSFIEAACQILKRGFMVGETYSNRQRQYTVTEIRGPKLLVRFNDGSIGTLDAEIQRSIITNMTRELDWLTQDLDAGSLDLRRKSMFSAGFLAAVADLQAEVLPQSNATGGEPIARKPKKTPPNEQKGKAIELKRQGDKMRVYVGNLSYGVTKEDLRTEFAAFGKVTSVSIITDKYSGRSKGFAFVDMPTISEGQQAIITLNGKILRDSTLSVRAARERTEERGSS